MKQKWKKGKNKTNVYLKKEPIRNAKMIELLEFKNSDEINARGN